MKVTVVCLGPAGKSMLTFAAWQALEKAESLILRTQQHDICDDLEAQGIPYTTLDDYYTDAGDFDALHETLAKAVWQSAKQNNVVYGVSDPNWDGSVRALYRLKPLRGHIEVIPGVSLVENCLSHLPKGPQGPGLRVMPAMELAVAPLMPQQPLMVTELNSAVTCGEVKLKLMTLYPDEMPITFFTPGGKVKAIPLWELDQQKRYDHMACAYLPALPMEDRQRYQVNDLEALMARLRGPEGCPWDKKQTHQSLRQYLLEECYEAVAAIDEGDMTHLCEELGDVLLQVVFHANVAQQHGEFDLMDVTTGIVRKMIRRHAHIFGDDICSSPEDVIKNWETLKQKEKGLETAAAALHEIPRAMPALMRAQKAQDKARRLGLEAAYSFDEVMEEAIKANRAFGEALKSGQDAGEALGQWLMCLTYAAQLAGLNAELCLGEATRAYINDFDAT